MREDPFGDLVLLRFAGESRGGVTASATTRFGDGLLRGLLRNACEVGIEIQNMTTVEYRSTAKMVVAMTE